VTNLEKAVDDETTAGKEPTVNDARDREKAALDNVRKFLDEIHEMNLRI
jgi:hypothetical protein